MAETRSALIIASGAFADPRLPRLRGVVRDASALAGVLEDPDAGDFDVRTLVDQPAEAIRAGMAEFFGGRRPGDLLVVYSASHVLRGTNGEFYFAAADTAADRLEATA